MVLSILGYGLAAAASYQILKLSRKFVKWYFTPLNRLPGPKRSFLLGTFWEIMKVPFMVHHFQWWEDAGKEDTDFIHYTGLMGVSSVLMLNADHVKQMLLLANYTNDPPQYVKKIFIAEMILGKGLVTLEGADWHRHRRIIQPSFQVSFIKDNLDRSVPHRVTNLLDCWKRAGPDRVIDIASHFSMLTLDILGDIAFAHDFRGMQAIQKWANKSQHDIDKTTVDELPQVSDRLVQSMNASMQATPKRILVSIFGLGILDREASRTQQTLDDAVAEVVQNARERYEQRGRSSVSSTSSKYSAKSVLEVLLDAEYAEQDASDNKSKRTLSTKELQAEVKTFLVAGHETTSTWCYWAIYCLCRYPEIQKLLYQDIIKYAPKDGESSDDDGYIGLDTVEKMTYFDAFLKETLRLYAPVGMLLRFNVQDETFGDTTIPADTRIAVPIYLMHRSPRYWKDPDDFQPERWLSKEAPHSHPYAYLPFSHGPRNCIGYRFATMEVKLILAPILRAVQLDFISELQDVDFELTSYIIVKSKPAVKVNAKFRE